MPKEGEKTSKIEIDNDLIKSAEAYLETLPKTPSEVIEQWIYLGKAVARHLTEQEQLILMSGTGKLSIERPENCT